MGVRQCESEKEGERRESRCDFYWPYHFGEQGWLTSGKQTKKTKKI